MKVEGVLAVVRQRVVYLASSMAIVESVAYARQPHQWTDLDPEM